MKNLLLLTALVSMLAACASEPMSAQQVSDHAACRRTDAPTGSNLVRKSECAPQAVQQDAAAPAPTKKN